MQGGIRLRWLCSLGLCAIAAGCPGGGRESTDPEPVDPPKQVRTPQEATGLVERLNVAVAILENYELDKPSIKEAISQLESLSQDAPEEVAPLRNLVIARLLPLSDGSVRAGEERNDAIQKTRDALTALLELEGETVATHTLAARLALEEDDRTRAISELQAASALDPEDIPAVYEQYEIGILARDSNMQQQAEAALAKAYAMAPTNLSLLRQRLESQARAKDTDIIQTLKTGRPRWQQIADGVRERTRADLVEMANATLEAAEQEDWDLAFANARAIANVTNAEEAKQSDHRLITRHLLDLILDGLSAETRSLARESQEPDAAVAISFSPAKDEPGTLIEGHVTSLVVCDVDLDTSLDIVCVRDGRLEVWRQEDGWSLMMSHESESPATSVVTADLDDDAEEGPPFRREEEGLIIDHHRADLDFVTFGGGMTALQNTAGESGRSFNLIELPAELAQADIQEVVPADLDIDGDLDLLVLEDAGITLWQNRGNLTFAGDRVKTAGLPAGTTVTAALPIDWDGDLDLDVIVATDTGVLGLLESLRHGEFQWRELKDDIGMFAAVIQPLDRGGSWDLLLAGDAGLKRIRTSAKVSGTVEIEGVESLNDRACTGLRVEDLNNDQFLDALTWSTDSITVYRGGPGSVIDHAGEPLETGQAAIPIEDVDVASLDQDGRLDLLVAGANGIVLLMNTSDPAPAWIDASLVAAQIKGSDAAASGRVNHYGIGSIVELRDGVHRQRQLVQRPVIHFGTGNAEQVDALRILWTNGVPENVIQPQARTFVWEEQTLTGSCPYLFGWDGERFVFISDLCWAAPLGLINPQGEIVPDRSWEYLKIDGALLKPRDGKYELRITEELWETAYFDSVRLYAVDHPAGTDVYTNEKVGPPSIAEHRLHTVHQRRVPVAAVDQRGRDVLPLLLDEDDQYVRLFDEKFTQGYTEPTTLELDLGDLVDPQQVTLFLTGWIYPTNTTINVALSQNPDDAGPRPPSLAVPDKNGDWQTVIPYTGYPGGKTKTIAIDLSEGFLTDDYRIRLSTSLELYWDAVFFTVDDAPVEVRETELSLHRAELRRRGVSAKIIHPQFGPERYDYDSVLPSHWHPLRGHFTRLGDVRELLTEDDDRLVVMGSGDEIVLEFDAPDPPPPGWTRDFVIRNVGWDKDADLQTVFGQSSEPLPYGGMSRYPFAAHEAPPDTREYREYLREYQTREFAPRRP